MVVESVVVVLPAGAMASPAGGVVAVASAGGVVVVEVLVDSVVEAGAFACCWHADRLSAARTEAEAKVTIFKADMSGVLPVTFTNTGRSRLFPRP